MSHKEDLGYSVMKIWIALLALTAIEVAWAMPEAIRGVRWLLWGGLGVCAFIKGALIFMYFMHMKFERFIVWSLIVPTPMLVLVILTALMPDLSFNDVRDHPNTHMLGADGRVVDVFQAGAGGHAAEGEGH